MKVKKILLGVDEAGRGPLAGPVAVGVVWAPADLDVRVHFPGVDDSKKLSEKKREKIFTLLEEKQGERVLRYIVVFASAATIDEVGITAAVRGAVWEGVRALASDATGVHVLLDGLLKAPPEYSQETIVHGDAIEPLISLASIAAKVTRDRLMGELELHYPGYGLRRHKGYGTRAHYEALGRLGPSAIHRRTFL